MLGDAGRGGMKTAQTPDSSRFCQEPLEPDVSVLQRRLCHSGVEGGQARAATVFDRSVTSAAFVT